MCQFLESKLEKWRHTKLTGTFFERINTINVKCGLFVNSTIKRRKEHLLELQKFYISIYYIVMSLEDYSYRIQDLGREASEIARSFKHNQSCLSL